MKTDVYNLKNEVVGNMELPDAVFGAKWNATLVQQVLEAQRANARVPWAHVKDRSEVRGGGKKPWRQKGTGRARHGSTRSPIWVGGGVAHGPRNTKIFARSIPKAMRNRALAMALSRKFKEGEVLFVESFELSSPKTAEAKKALTKLAGIKGFERLSTKKKNAALIAAPEKEAALEKSFRNLGNTATARVANLNPVAVLRSSYIIFENPQASLEAIETRLAKKAKVSATK